MKIPIFAHVAAGSFLFPAATGICLWKKNNISLKVLTVFSCFSFLQVIAEYILGRLNVHNQFLLNYHQIVEFECFIFIFHRWTSKKNLKDFLHIIGLLYLLYWIVDVAFITTSTEFRESISTAANILLIICSLIILYELFRAERAQISSYSIFWIASGVMLYASGTVVVVSFSNTILKMGIEYFNLLWHVNWVFTIIGNLFYTRSFLCRTF